MVLIKLAFSAVSSNKLFSNYSQMKGWSIPMFDNLFQEYKAQLNYNMVFYKAVTSLSLWKLAGATMRLSYIQVNHHSLLLGSRE